MCINVINGLQKPVRSTMLNFMRTILMLIPAVWIGGKIGAVTGIFAAISTTSIVAFFIYHATVKITIEKI
jgi:Na+-driven multidrug efflux pump